MPQGNCPFLLTFLWQHPFDFHAKIISASGCRLQGMERIRAPSPAGGKRHYDLAPILSEPKPTENGDTQPEPQLLGFRPARVWDIDQTEGEPAEISSTINPDLSDVLKKLMELAVSQEIEIQYSEKIAPAKGTSYRGVIRLLPDMQAEETILALVRELAIQMLYETDRRSFVTRDVLLREAKAVVFVAGYALNLASESEDSIELYQGNINLLAESLEVVKRTSAIILGAISPRGEHEGGN
jgi:hypothetical protein